MKLEVKNLVKTFGGRRVIDGVSAVFETGNIYGLFGRNGVGKSTLFRCIDDRIPFEEGSIEVDGVDARDSSGLVALANETRELRGGSPRVEKGLGHVGGGDDLALRVIGRGLGTEGEARSIPLSVEREKPEELCRLTDAHDEDPGRRRVERAGMAHAPLAHRATDARDDVMAGHARGLVDGYERGEGARTTAQRPSSA